jgi:hypothetical protein
MGWVFDRPSLAAIEAGWRWIFGIPFLIVCWMQVQQILVLLPLESTGLSSLDPENPWVAAVQLVRAFSLYRPHVAAVLRWLLPVAALAWVVVSGLGRSLVLMRLTASLGSNTDSNLKPRLIFRPLQIIVLQAAWLILFAATWWGWFRSIEWAVATHIATAGEPDLVGFSVWLIFLSLGFFTAWALLNWPFAIAPLLVLLEDCTPAQALARSLRLGKPFTSKLVETNLVMGIVKLALIVLAMVLSAAPLPFSDQLGPDALHCITAVAALFYLVANDYFQVVRLKGFVEFWKMFRNGESVSR